MHLHPQRIRAFEVITLTLGQAEAACLQTVPDLSAGVRHQLAAQVSPPSRFTYVQITVGYEDAARLLASDIVPPPVKWRIAPQLPPRPRPAESWRDPFAGGRSRWWCW